MAEPLTTRKNPATADVRSMGTQAAYNQVMNFLKKELPSFTHPPTEGHPSARSDTTRTWAKKYLQNIKLSQNPESTSDIVQHFETALKKMLNHPEIDMDRIAWLVAADSKYGPFSKLTVATPRSEGDVV